MGLTQLPAGDVLLTLSPLIALKQASWGSLGISEGDIKQYLLVHGIDKGDFEMCYGAQGYGLYIYIRDPEGTIVELRSTL